MRMKKEFKILGCDNKECKLPCLRKKRIYKVKITAIQTEENICGLFVVNKKKLPKIYKQIADLWEV